MRQHARKNLNHLVLRIMNIRQSHKGTATSKKCQPVLSMQDLPSLSSQCVKYSRGWCIKFATGLNGRFTTISSHFVANYIDIFHKTVVQTVILRCWTGLYLIWKQTKYKKRKKPKKVQKLWKTLYKWVFFYKIAKIQKQKYLCFVS